MIEAITGSIGKPTNWQRDDSLSPCAFTQSSFSTDSDTPFKCRHFLPSIVIWAVRWYLALLAY